MSAEWKVVGQAGTISKSGNLYLVNIADNRYRNGKKVSTIWFHCMCKFKPRVKKGDSVIAYGMFEESKNEKFQYAMMIDHIGVIDKGEMGEDPSFNDECGVEMEKGGE